MKTNPNDSIHNSEQGAQDGLTKREYFATHAPAHIFEKKYTLGDIVKVLGKQYDRIESSDYINFEARLAVSWADALTNAPNESQGD